MNFGRSKRNFAIAYLGMLLSLAGWGESVHGAYVTYSSQANFLAAAGGGTSTENFDGLASGQRFTAPTVLDGVTYASTAPNSQWIVVPGDLTTLLVPESAPNVFLLSPGSTSAELWFDGGSTSAFGLALIARATSSPTDPTRYVVTAFNSLGTPFSALVTLTGTNPGYFGITASGGSQGISEIAITPLSGSGSAVLLDDVSHSTITPGSFTLLPPLAGVVPEPASWVMMTTGLAVVAGLTLRRRFGAL
jgi:hypothetical protein